MLYKLNIKIAEKLVKLDESTIYYEFLNENLNSGIIEKLGAKYKIENISLLESRLKSEKNKRIKVNLNSQTTLIILKYNEKINIDYFRNESAAIIQNHDYSSYSKICLSVEKSDFTTKLFESEDYLYQSIFEGFELGNYTFNHYKEKKNVEKLEVTFITEDIKSAKQSLTKTNKIIEAVNFTKDLVNEPAITLTPIELAKRTKNKLSKLGINVTIWNKAQLKKNNMNTILAVGSASINEPCMIIAHYKPKKKASKKKASKKIALVGKGVTYDSGGLSIKSTAGMLQMNGDMAGGAAVIGSIAVAALLKLDVEIFSIIPAVENMISGNSYKPGDVVKSASGKTIEVKDTDAEGRLVLADALHYASSLKPDLIIDFATLTGAVAIALGLFSAGMMSKNNEITENIFKSAERTNEKVWRLPFGDEYKKLLDSDIADISNLGTRWGGSISAGKFLEYFVDENIPYVHLDIAGTALKNDFTNYTKKYHPGWGVRLMADYLERF